MIRGKLCRLRAIEAADVDSYHSWINDEDTNQWRGLHHPQSREACTKWIELQRTQRPEALSLAVETSDGILVGLIGLSEICARSRRAEVWIYLGSKPHWNQGIGEDSVRTLCNYAFDQMNLFRISLECNPEYSNVVKCYEKVGFVREGTLRKAYYRHGEFRDTCIMGLLRDEFSRGDL
jgi:RimJ/RimL family protein N-acetyltransferase